MKRFFSFNMRGVFSGEFRAFKAWLEVLRRAPGIPGERPARRGYRRAGPIEKKEITIVYGSDLDKNLKRLRGEVPLMP